MRFCNTNNKHFPNILPTLLNKQILLLEAPCLAFSPSSNLTFFYFHQNYSVYCLLKPTTSYSLDCTICHYLFLSMHIMQYLSLIFCNYHFLKWMFSSSQLRYYDMLSKSFILIFRVLQSKKFITHREAI